MKNDIVLVWKSVGNMTGQIIMQITA